MENNSYKEKYLEWVRKTGEMKDTVLEAELLSMDDSQIEDAFFKEMEFGTAGLRGIIGAGPNRMNVYTVARAAQGQAEYIKKGDNLSVAIAFDSRIMSDVFSRVAAEVFAANGIRVYIFPELMPTPCLSFAVRYFKCASGVVVTASHNPSKYNGYKVYGPDGCQCTSAAANAIYEEIQKLDMFFGAKRVDFDTAVAEGMIVIIGDDCETAFVESVKSLSVLYGDEIDRSVEIVYTPLNGSGLKPVLRTLKESGFENIFVVPEQEQPDGNFPTCPYPNPEIRGALELGLKYADERGADLLIATDPDSDRIGIAVRGRDGMQLISGNDVGVLLIDYICGQKTRHGMMPENPIVVKTVVTTTMADAVANSYGAGIIDVLTGFKYIGEQITRLEEKGEENRFLFGYEESYGYMSGTHVRDKDGVNGAFIICEMFAYYKTRGTSIAERLEELYKTFGYRLNLTKSYEFDGAAGFARMQEIMAEVKKGLAEIGGLKVIKTLDYSKGLNGLPPSDVMKFLLEKDCSVVIRPSGTEPKIKAYISMVGSNWEEAERMAERANQEICNNIMKK